MTVLMRFKSLTEKVGFKAPAERLNTSRTFQLWMEIVPKSPGLNRETPTTICLQAIPGDSEKTLVFRPQGSSRYIWCEELVYIHG